MSKEIVPNELIESRILVLRGHKVMLDRDLAALYGVKTKVLNQAVARNKARFPEDFMFQLTVEELENWRSQFVTSNSGLKRGLRWRPYAFTENNELVAICDRFIARTRGTGSWPARTTCARPIIWRTWPRNSRKRP